MSDAGVQDSQVSHVILTHSHFDHAGMLEALRFIIDLGPRTLIHGHILLTEVFTMETVTGLPPALSELREQALAGLGADLTLTALLDSNILPDVLRENPAAVGPYLAIRDHFVQRLHRQHTGYWQSDGQGLDPVAPAELRQQALYHLMERHQFQDPFRFNVYALHRARRRDSEPQAQPLPDSSTQMSGQRAEGAHINRSGMTRVTLPAGRP
jgi:hypothetical protein